MQNSKLISLIKTFSKEELERFGDFVSSPYFNKNSNITKLFRHLSKFYSGYDNDKLAKENVYNKIFPGRSYNVKTIKNLMSGLLKLAEKFLGQTNYESQKGDKNVYLLGELLQRKLYNNFKRNLLSAEDIVSKSCISEENYYNILNLEELKHSFELRINPGLENVRDSKNIFEPLFCLFTMYFFKIIGNLKIKQKDYNFIYDFTADIEFSERLIKYIKQKSFNSEPIILIYYYLFMIYNSEDDFYFNEFRNLVNKHFDLFNRKEKRNFHLAMVTYCTKKLANGYEIYAKTSFDIYEEMLKNKTYSYDQTDRMLPLVFKNFVKSGVRANEFDWTMNFIEQYKNRLTDGYDNNLYNFSLSILYFKKRDFKKSTEFLSKVNYEGVYDKLDVKSLLIQLYYEMNSMEELLSQLDTFKHFLNNDKIVPVEKKTIYSNFIQLAYNLTKLKFDKTKSYDIIILEKEVERTITYDKSWLLEKLKEFKN